eukprot:9671927-Alexandrium_andersonii.AAC.1
MADEEHGTDTAVKACCTEVPDTMARMKPKADEEQGAEDAATARSTEAPDIAMKQQPKTM